MKDEGWGKVEVLARVLVRPASAELVLVRPASAELVRPASAGLVLLLVLLPLLLLLLLFILHPSSFCLYLITPRRDDSMNSTSPSTSAEAVISSAIFSSACEVLSFEASNR
jgi:hypothetical protein